MKARAHQWPAAPLNAWNSLVAGVATLAALVVPAHVVGGRELVTHYILYDVGFTILFLADLVVHFNSGGDLPPLRRWLLTGCDILAFLPLDLVTGVPVFALLRLLKLIRVGGLMGEWRYQHLQRWNILRLVYFVYWLGLCVHWLACGWLTLRGMPPGTDAWTAYVHSLYWCVSTLTTIGYADNMPKTNPEILYSIIVMIFGVATYGYVIGNAANILVNIDPARAGYLGHMEKLSSFMNYRGIPPELQRRVQDYHTYVWEHRLGYDEEGILSGLPPSLMIEVSMFLKREVIQNVPFFATADDEMLKEIALSMHPVVYMPGDVIVRKGEVGRAMFFISSGEVEVIGQDEARLARLGRGDAFGEMALVLNKPRGATVQAIGYCDLYRLDQGAFNDILKRFPEFATHVRQLTKLRGSGKAAPGV